MDVAGLGIVVRAARIAQGLTRDDLVNVTGLSPKFITHVEAGKPTAQIGKIFILLSELGISLHVQTPVPISPKVAEQARRTRRSSHAR
ncbi:helix-turn-helix domain-containing protein [Paraburkholderia sp. BCC1886]|uniref:helix-turn-helix domain-containing protein n=1 Tax=Paraburkholderia sp. BCC1886 TaxID=2562670 RepID=UPI001182DA3B|nr:helix-turn-helix domain-containing protein [Paraburkholderia sp. BCC1886]